MSQLSLWSNVANAMPVSMLNFVPICSAKLGVSEVPNTTPALGSFLIGSGNVPSIFKITNTGTAIAYIAWGSGGASPVVSTTAWAPQCDAIAPGAIFTQSFINQANTPYADKVIDTIGAVCASGLSTTLEITYGVGQ
jgi:hypothetical protein